MATILERVTAVVVDKLGVEKVQVTEEASFVEDLNADSLDLVELIMALEDEFKGDIAERYRNSQGDFKIPDEEAGELHAVQNVVEYIEARMAGETADV